MLRLLACCPGMGAALSQPQEGVGCGPQPAPATMAEVIRERKRKAGGAGLATLRRRLARRRPAGGGGGGGCEHARLVRQLVGGWRPAEVAALCEEYEAAAALRDLLTQAELAREPAPTLRADLAHLYADRWCGDAELLYRGSVFTVHRAILSARCPFFRDLLAAHPAAGARVCVEGVPPHVTAEDLDTVLRAIYAGDEPPPPECCAEGAASGWCSCQRLAACTACTKGRQCGGECARAHLDIIGSDPTLGRRGGGGGGAGARRLHDSASLRRAAEQFGFRLDTLHRDMRYLLDSGDYSDASLVFSWEGSGGGGAGGAGGGWGGRASSDYGFRPQLELPCHRAVLAARSPFFRSVIARRERAAAAGGEEARRRGAAAAVRVCVDERVLPRRFARALLHAAYTDQVDLSLVTRAASPPSSAGSAPPTAWGVGRGGAAAAAAPGAGAGKAPAARQNAALDDACELYEIARFLEMRIVVQGCEDAIVEALSGETLPRVLEWSRAPHASKWVHRQATRYLRDEFASLAGGAALPSLPRGALADALASPFLQASETQALRALLRWGERAAQARAEETEPNVVWHTAHSVSRRRERRRDASDAELREAIAPLAPLLRLEHALPPDSDVLREARRRSLVSTPPPQMVEGGGSADAWLGRGPYRPPRLFLPYYEEIKALLEDQLVAEAEVSRVRRARYVHRIPDTLYMVSAERAAGEPPPGGWGEGAEVAAIAEAAPAPRVLRALRARARELRAAPPAARALRHPTADRQQIHKQIALRTVREFSLPDACAELLPAPPDAEPAPAHRWGGSSDDECDAQCSCPMSRSGGGGGGSCAGEAESRAPSAGSQRSSQREGSWRRGGSDPAPPSVQLTGAPLPASGRYAGATPCDDSEAPGGRLSEAVPDVAMCRSGVPNANTHLLSSRDYFRAVFTPREFSACGGGMLQLDLGDGATHAPPRHGSRAHRAAPAPAAASAPPRPAHRDAQLQQAMGSLSLQRRERAASERRAPTAGAGRDELRAAVELSVMQAYSSLLPRSLSPARAHRSATLPHHTAAAPHHAARAPSPGDHLRLAASLSDAAAALRHSDRSILSSVSPGHLSVSNVSGHLSGMSGSNSGHLSAISGNSGHLSGMSGNSGHLSAMSGNTGHLSGISGNSGHLSGISSNSGHLSGMSRNLSNLSNVSGLNAGHSSTLSNVSALNTGHLSALSGNSGGHFSGMSGSNGGHLSNVSGHPSGMSGHASNLSGHTSGMGGHTSNLSGHTSGMSGHSSGMSGHASNASGHASNVSGHASNASGHASNVSGHTSNLSGHTSNASGHGGRGVANVSGLSAGHVSNVSGHIISSGSARRTASPRPGAAYVHYRTHHEMRGEAGGGPGASPRGSSPSGYA